MKVARVACALSLVWTGCKSKPPPSEPAELPSIQLRGRSPELDGEVRKLAPAVSGAAGEQLGASVAVGRDFVAALAEKSGRLIVLERAAAGAWGPARDASLDKTSLASRGAVLAAAERSLFVGAPSEDEARGLTLVLERGEKGWATVARLEAADRRPGERCGGALAASGDVLAVACARRIVVFEKNKETRTFVQVGSLPARDEALEPGASLGGAVTITSTGAVVARVGAPSKPTSLFTLARDAKGKWGEARRELGVEGASDGFAGGAYLALQSRPRSGPSTLTLLELDGATPVATFEGGKLFGERLAMSGSLLVAGERTARTVGRVHAYRLQGKAWSLHAVLAPENGKAFDWFGAAVAVRDGTVAIGAPAHAARAGAVYVTTLDP